MLAIASLLIHVSPMLGCAFLLRRAAVDLIVSVIALLRCEQNQTADTIRALAEFRKRK